MKKRLISLATIAILALMVLSGCRQSDRVSYNVSRSADEFEVVRRVTVLNMRSDSIVFEAIGHISIETGNSERLVVMARTDEDTYKKHYINLNEWNMYVVEDLHGIDVNNYQYEVRYNPEMIKPIEVIKDK